MDERFTNAALIDDQFLDPLKQECNDYNQQRKVLTQASLVESVPLLLDANKLQILVNAANKHHSNSEEATPQYSTEEVIQLYQESFKEALAIATRELNHSLARHQRAIDYLQVQLANLANYSKSQSIEQAFNQGDSTTVKQWQDDLEQVVNKINTYQQILDDCYTKDIIPQVGNDDASTLLDPCEKFTQNMPSWLNFSGRHNSRLAPWRSEGILRHSLQNWSTLNWDIRAKSEVDAMIVLANDPLIDCEEVWHDPIRVLVCKLLNQKLGQNVKK